MITTQQIFEYLSENVTDPVPKFIMQKEIYNEPVDSPGYQNAINQINHSKWYRELAEEQWEDGSWGRFHSQDSKAAISKNLLQLSLHSEEHFS